MIPSNPKVINFIRDSQWTVLQAEYSILLTYSLSTLHATVPLGIGVVVSVLLCVLLCMVSFSCLVIFSA